MGTPQPQTERSPMPGVRQEVSPAPRQHAVLFAPVRQREQCGEEQMREIKCGQCGAVFNPRSRTTQYCSRRCSWTANGHRARNEKGWWNPVNNRGYIKGVIWLLDGTKAVVRQHR